jgi:hypothetical protein
MYSLLCILKTYLAEARWRFHDLLDARLIAHSPFLMRYILDHLGLLTYETGLIDLGVSY